MVADRDIKPAIAQPQWVVAYASVAGGYHVQGSTPCQDACCHQAMGNGWGVAAVADGAGSYACSGTGADLAVSLIVEKLKNHTQDWMGKGELPGTSYWQHTAQQAFHSIYQQLAQYAAAQEMDVMELSCTLIAAVYAPMGILIAHIGDGRAGYRDAAGNWHSAMQPLHGEHAGETLFLTSTQVWQPEGDHYIECRVVQEPVQAFVLMTDGMEKAAFRCNVYDEAQQRFTDPNEPHPAFLDPNVKALQRLYAERQSQEDINALWENFLAGGNERLRNEPDDKTMLLGARVE